MLRLPRGEVAVIGLGRSGKAAVRLLRREGSAVYASDSGAPNPTVATELAELGVAVEFGGHDNGRIARAALVIVSPGVPPAAPPLEAARSARVPIWSEAELGLQALGGRAPFAAVTGTNGKTTTTAIIAHLLGSAGHRTVACGNIGTPLSEVALVEPAPELLAVELSSFQLHDMPTLAPPVGVLTNLAPDHLDRYPTLEAYYGDKMRLFANATAASIWITNADDATSLQWVGEPLGTRRQFSTTAQADAWFDRTASALILDGRPLLNRAELPLLGDHNVGNALAAALAAQALGAGSSSISDGLRTVRALPHRMEPIREVGGVLWINDSKATNISSTEVAVRAMDRPFVLLLGGRHKGEPYTRLAPLLGQCRAVIAYGEAGPKVLADLGSSVRVVPAQGFDQVLRTAASLVSRGDAVLLSPACSSYDMFANYEERGTRFRHAVEAL